MSNILGHNNLKSVQECVGLHQKILKPFNKFAVSVLPSLKQLAVSHVLNLIKHCCSFIKHYLKMLSVFVWLVFYLACTYLHC